MEGRGDAKEGGGGGLGSGREETGVILKKEEEKNPTYINRFEYIIQV